MVWLVLLVLVLLVPVLLLLQGWNVSTVTSGQWMVDGRRWPPLIAYLLQPASIMPGNTALERFFEEPVFCAGQIPRQRETRELCVSDPLPETLEHDVFVSESQHALEKVLEFIDGLHHGWNLQVSMHLCDKIVSRALADAKAKTKEESMAKPRLFRCDVRCSMTELNPSAFSISGPRRSPNGNAPSMPPPSVLQRRSSTDRNGQPQPSRMFSNKMDMLDEKELSKLGQPEEVKSPDARSTLHKMSFERKNINVDVLVTWIPLSASGSNLSVDQQDPTHPRLGSECRCWICNSMDMEYAWELDPGAQNQHKRQSQQSQPAV
ncbi:hypothetical protein K490DRAFT_54854 [Saccharata proteae CBS 121410]|uniref:Uncharacterized protein n=1 Tax=Saccharata proteae CBS 121410 TaxID=1314787 RepID=A0A6A5YC29_9PEZI|nr:hypothetical protein K490DRAFT_54854 [Saccharata proteae CBS 121410]